MASAKSVTVVTLLAAVIVVCHGQSVGVANNIYDSLAPLGCSQFLAILNKCRDSMKNLFRQQATWTVFVPNDTAFNVLPPSKRNEIINMNQEQSENYVNSFTLSTKALLTTQFQESRPEQSNSPLRTKLFLMSRVRRQGDSASGVAGPTEYYVNGAMVVRANVPAGTALIHVIDRVLDTPSGFSVFAYISLSSQPDTAFFNELLNHLREVEYYNQIVIPLNQYERITAFIPTKEALGRIPSERLRELQGNPVLMNEFIRMHIIPYQVVYTSFVYHNEGVNSMGKGQIIFRKSTGRETVFVNSGGVTAEIVQGNITCTNGAIHFIDTLMGYTYNSAKDEIELNPITQNFETILSQARTELRDVFTSSIGVTAFIPINQALNSIPGYNNLLTNQSLINTIVELSMLELGQEFELTRVNGDYYSRVTLTSRHFRQPIGVYSQGNETWIESGYVKARVVRPDVKVTNGFIHLIDAVPGAPTRDVPNTIFCEDWLIKSSLQLYVTGLNDYMRDTRLQSVAACTTSGGVRSSANVYDAFDDLYYPITSEQSTQRPCGNCAFTVFIPNGTAIEFFENTPFGREVQANVQLWQYVLKRHITRQLIYLDKIAVGVERSFTSLNGEEVRYRRATDRYAYVYFAGRQASILHSDLAGTNGVIHIIDQVLYVSEDLYRSSGEQLRSSFFIYALCLLIWIVLRHY